MSLALVLSVLQCERGDHDSGVEMAVSLYFRAMQTVEDFARVGGKGGEDFGAGSTHAEQTNRRFGVGLGFGVEDEVCGIGLGFPAGGEVVAVAARFAVIHTIRTLVSRGVKIMLEGRKGSYTLSSLLLTPSWRYCGPAALGRIWGEYSSNWDLSVEVSEDDEVEMGF